MLRWLRVTERGKYKVASPNALWHIEGHHKLIRFVSQNYKVVAFTAIFVYLVVVVVVTCLCIKGL